MVGRVAADRGRLHATSPRGAPARDPGLARLTPIDPTEEQVRQVVRLLELALGRELHGIYLYGSATDDGLRPASDIDLFVLVGRPTTDEQRHRLVDGLRPISSRAHRPADWRPVELTIVVADQVRPWRYPPVMDFQYGEWLRAEFDAGPIPPPRPNPDLAVLVTMVRESGRPIVGPPATDLLDPVPTSDLHRAMTDSLPALLADLESDTANVLLTLARMWMTSETGRIGSKSEAAEWALDRLPPERGASLHRALAVHEGAAEDRWDDLAAEARTDAAHLAREVARAAARLGR